MRSQIDFNYGDIIDLSVYTNEFTSPSGMITTISHTSPTRTGKIVHNFSGGFIAKEAVGDFLYQVVTRNGVITRIQVSFTDVEYMDV